MEKKNMNGNRNENSKETPKKGADSFEEALNAAGFNTEGIEMKEDTKVLDIFAKLGVGKIIICKDVRDFDMGNVEQMREEGKVLCEFSMDEVLQHDPHSTESTKKQVE